VLFSRIVRLMREKETDTVGPVSVSFSHICRIVLQYGIPIRFFPLRQRGHLGWVGGGKSDFPSAGPSTKTAIIYYSRHINNKGIRV
jgi:hypothetical protein